MSTAAGLPILDLEGFAFDEAGAGRIAQRMDAIFSDTGFCYIANTGIDPALMQGIFAASKAFHALDRAAKDRLAINVFHRGYMAPKTSLIVTSSVAKVAKPNNSESFMLMHEVPPDDPRFGQPLQGPNQWPAELPAFKATVEAYDRALRALGQAFTRLIARALGLEPQGLDRYFEQPTTFLRLLHYPPHPDAAEDEFGSAPHTDYGFVTILLQDGVGGLEVRHKDGSWIRATPIEGTFVVNVADMLSRWSGGRWQSTPHRVRNTAQVDRYSVPYFFDPAMDSVITPLRADGALADPAPVRYGDYLLERLDKNYSYRKQAS